jgi:mannose-6-phosphate isomerase-like protein (cupin superfamily)
MREIIRVGDMHITFLKTRHETGDRLDLFEITIPSQRQMIVPHLHRDYDETIIGLNGITTWTLGGETMTVGPGQTLVIPRGLPHTFANMHKPTARIMCINTPGLIGPEYFREIAAIVDDEGPEALPEIGAVMTRYGVIPVTP